MSGICGVVSWNPTGTVIPAESLPRSDYWRGSASRLDITSRSRVELTHSADRGSLHSDAQYKIGFLGASSVRMLPLADVGSALTRDPAALLNSLNGEFALAFADPHREELIVAADRFGSYPIFYFVDADSIVFSSDLASLAAQPAAGRTISKQAIYNYLYFSAIPAPQTVYESIKRLPAGHYLTYAGNRLQVTRWYEPETDSAFSSTEQESTLRDALGQATASRWEDDTTACFLSGGLDSTTICGLAAKASAAPVPAYSIGFSADGYDEIAYAKIASEKFGLSHNVHYVSAEEVAANVTMLSHAFGEPFSNASAVSTYICAQKARNDGFSRLLAGDGGDELFAGNERYAKQVLLHYFDRLPGSVQSLAQKVLRGSLGRLPLLSKVGSFVEQAAIPVPKRFQYYNFIEQSGPENIFSRGFLQNVDIEWPVEHLRHLFEDAPFDDFVKRMLYMDWQITLADNDLRKVRVACDLAGMDVAFPMLGQSVVAVAEAMNGRDMMKGNRLRYFFKKAFSEFLPPETINKPKHGFGVPVGLWIKSVPALDQLVEDKLTNLRERDIFNPGFLDETRRNHKTDNAIHYGVALWTLLMLELWLERHGDV